MFLMWSQVKKSAQCQLRDKKHQQVLFNCLIATDSVIVDHDHAVQIVVGTPESPIYS
jgi:hypothetical protein